MKFKTFLENYRLAESDADEVRVLNLLKKLKSECSEYISAPYYSNAEFYRGISPNVFKTKTDEEVFYTSLTERSPRDSTVAFNRWFNTFMEMAHGIKELRKNCVFVSTNPLFIADYGQKCLMYPKSQFKYLWSPEVPDSWENRENIYNRVYQIMTVLIDSKINIDPDDVPTMISALFGEGARNSDINALKDQGADIQFLQDAKEQNLGKQSLNHLSNALKRSEDDVQKIAAIFVEAMVRFFKKNYISTDIEKSFEMNHGYGAEIFIYDCPGYWTVNVEGACTAMGISSNFVENLKGVIREA